MTESRYTFRPPTVDDARAVHRLVHDSGVLDLNSAYAYLVLCRDFAQTSVIAEDELGPAGFVMGFRPPPRPEALFVWQVGVAERARRAGLAGRMLTELVARTGVRTLEATVTPTNEPSQRLFRGFARRLDVPCVESLSEGFPRHLFPDEGHEEEVLFRIGPFATGGPAPNSNPIREDTTSCR